MFCPMGMLWMPMSLDSWEGSLGNKKKARIEKDSFGSYTVVPSWSAERAQQLPKASLEEIEKLYDDHFTTAGAGPLHESFRALYTKFKDSVAILPKDLSKEGKK